MTDAEGRLVPVHARSHLTLTLDGCICEGCNNGFLARLEQSVKPLLAPMAVRNEAVVLSTEHQRTLATWAVKTVFLLELALLQRYLRRPTAGYPPTEVELASLILGEPPPRSQVWIACVDAMGIKPLRYEPSLLPIPTRSGETLLGHVTTVALGYVAFQVFSTDFVRAELLKATPAWPTTPPAIAAGLLQIWPPLQPVSWPPAAFADGDWNRLVTRDGALRRTSG